MNIKRLPIKHVVPRFECGRWGGAAITCDGSPQGDEVGGWCIAVQWLGLMIEIGFGRLEP